MVFKPFSHLARRSTKAFAHGYAQSLAAASQSSYASTQTPLGHLNHYRLGKTLTLQHRDNHHQSTPQHSSGPKPSLSSPSENAHDGGLDAYFTAWQKHQSSDEWHQFIASRKQKWKNQTALPARLVTQDEAITKADLTERQRPNIERSHSTSDLESFKQAQVISDHQAVGHALDQDGGAQTAQRDQSASQEHHELVESRVLGESISEHDIVADLAQGNPVNPAPASPSFAFEEQVRRLEESKRWEEIPATVEAMLRSSLVPSAQAYNSLILSAIRLSASTAQTIPKALDIYSNMLRQRVEPDRFTYTLLLELLCLRALEVLEQRSSLLRNLQRFQRTGDRQGFMLRSRETELDIVREDDSFIIAFRLFEHATRLSSSLAFSAITYRYLIEACARCGDTEQMIQVYTHMEAHKVMPLAASYPPMIKAFAKSGDLHSAVECYNGYKTLAMADDAGKPTLSTRADQDVYNAVVSSYVHCGKMEGAEKFVFKVIRLLGTLGKDMNVQNSSDSFLLEGYVTECIAGGRLEEALVHTMKQPVSMSARHAALGCVASAAADRNQLQIAEKVYWDSFEVQANASSSISMLAMYVRNRDVPSARKVWSILSERTVVGLDYVEPFVAYAVCLIDAGFVNESVVQTRSSFKQIRQSCPVRQSQEASELIDEGMEHIASSILRNHAVISPEAAMGLMWAMVENGGLLTSVAEQVLAVLGPEEIRSLSWQDLRLALQVEAGIVAGTPQSLDIAHRSRLACLLEIALLNGLPFDTRTSDLIDASITDLRHIRPDVVELWQAYPDSSPSRGSQRQPAHKTDSTLTTLTPSTPSEKLDPYGNTLDQRGSAAIIDDLERSGVSSNANLNDALSRLRNVRRTGRHPRYITYAKLISAAAREGRSATVQDLLGLAQQDMPLRAEYSSVRHGWAVILDAAVGAYLALGNRTSAAKYHQQLLDIGLAPSANTFGLYITTLKDSTKTFDEATEAVKIFLRAKSEGIEPTSFLYNALIGKLGKARRIDDCLFYFAEMRTRGVRPTSVTYGTIVNALCRVSDERFAEELFDEMESMPNYKPRPAPYNSMMQFFLTTKRDSSKVLEYYRRMQSRGIKPTMHTYKLLIDTYATLEPVNLTAAEGVLNSIYASGHAPEAVHYASLIHAKGCVLHDITGARAIFDDVLASKKIAPHPCVYQALCEALVANHQVCDTESLLKDMRLRQVEMTAYIANTLIHGWALENNIKKAKEVYDGIGRDKREPSTYEAMTRAFLAAGDYHNASTVIQEMLSRGYPSAVSSKILELQGHRPTREITTILPSESSGESILI